MLGIRYDFFRIMPADGEKRAWETLFYLPAYEKIGWASGARMQYLALGITFARIRSADSCFPSVGAFQAMKVGLGKPGSGCNVWHYVLFLSNQKCRLLDEIPWGETPPSPTARLPGLKAGL